jgi:hypothetical protein
MLTVGTALLLGATACANLDVVNPNDADAARALATPGDVESLIGGAYNTWFNGIYAYGGPALFLSNQSFQHNAPWANAAMEFYGRIPRNAIINDAADSYYGNFTRPWYYSYRAIAAVADAMRSLQDPAIGDVLGADNVLRDQAYGNFVLGVAHATLAILYDQAFIVDETTDVTEAQEAAPYTDVMAAAMGYFDKAISLAGQGSFTIPESWTATTGGISNTMLVKIAHSEKARYMAAVARTPADRKAVNWNAVMSEVDAGITETWAPYMDDHNGWGQESLDYGGYDGWTEMAYWMYGMADQSGNYQRWLAQPLSSKLPNPDDGDIVIVTPDTRFPRGSTIAEQRDNPGYFSDADAAKRGTLGNWAFAAPSDIGGVWAHPERGQWRWSYYRNESAHNTYSSSEAEDVPEIPIQEMMLLKAEGLYYKGDMAGAAAIINETRTQYGLNATDAAGTNTSCVPKLPDGSCGDLWEMLKWEKRMENQMTGLDLAPWFFDSRGWGDLLKDTPLEFPAPCKELQVLQILPCYSFGGSGGEMSAPVSTYHFPPES